MLGRHQPCAKEDSDVGIKIGTPTSDKHTHWWSSDVTTHQISRSLSLFLYKMRVVWSEWCISHSASGFAHPEIKKKTSRHLDMRWNLDIYNNSFVLRSFSCRLKILFSRAGGYKLFKLSGEFIHLGHQTKLLFRDYNPSWLPPWREMMVADDVLKSCYAGRCIMFSINISQLWKRAGTQGCTQSATWTNFAFWSNPACSDL